MLEVIKEFLAAPFGNFFFQLPCDEGDDGQLVEHMG